MAKNIERIAKKLGAEIVCQVPDVGGGAFGMARLAGIVAALQARLQPGQGQRPSRHANSAEKNTAQGGNPGRVWVWREAE